MIQPARTIAGLLLLATIVACNDAGEVGPPPQTTTPELHVESELRGTQMNRRTLSPEERQRVRPKFDPDALEDLLQLLPPEHVENVIPFFLEGGERGSAVVVEMTFGGEAAQAALDRVWAPAWGGHSDEALLRVLEKAEVAGDRPPPGVRTVLERRGLR